jgi:hypothetical protein
MPNTPPLGPPNTFWYREVRDDRDAVEIVRDAFKQLHVAPRLRGGGRTGRTNRGLAVGSTTTKTTPPEAYSTLRETFCITDGDDEIRDALDRLRDGQGRERALAAINVIETDRRRDATSKSSHSDTPFLDALADLRGVITEDDDTDTADGFGFGIRGVQSND